MQRSSSPASEAGRPAGAGVAVWRTGPRAVPPQAAGSRYRAGCRPDRPRAPAAVRWPCSGADVPAAPCAEPARATRARSVWISRAAARTRCNPASSTPSRTLPSIRSRATVRVTSGIGSASNPSPRRKSAATSPARASSSPIQDRSSVGRRESRRPAPSGPTVYAATRSSTAPNSMVSSASAVCSAGNGSGVPPSVWAGTPWDERGSTCVISRPGAPRGRSG